MSMLVELPEQLYPSDSAIFAELDRSPNFSLGTATAMAWAAQLAYETDPDKLARILSQWGMVQSDRLLGRFASLLPITSTKGYITGNDAVTIIAFSGTDPVHLGDWVRDFSFFRTAEGIHRGFQDGVNVVWAHITSRLALSLNKSDRLYLTGHSLGAALAAVAAERLIRENIVSADRISGIYAFGMPRVGSGDFAARYEPMLGVKTFRLVYGEDLVARVPPHDDPFGFVHIGRCLRCRYGGRLDGTNLLPEVSEDPGDLKLSLRELLRIFGQFPRPDQPPHPGDPLTAAVISHPQPVIRDHIPDSYLRGLGAPL
jgi:triacylglycerol lipase